MIDSTSPRRRIVSCLLVIAVLASGALVGVAASEYDVSTDSETDVPERTVEYGGSEYTISSVATAQVDGSTTVSVQVPDNTGYGLDIYNDNEQPVVDPRSGAGSQTETIDLSNVDPGTYAITLQVDGNVMDVKPLVVEGVSVSLSVPDEIEAGDSLTATVDTASMDGETTPQTVELAVWNDDDTIRVDATETDSGTYEATVDDLAAGDYRVYAAAQGSDTVMGEPSIIGISDRTSVTVTGDDGGGGSPSDPGDGGENDDGSDDENESDDPDDGDGTDDTNDGGSGDANETEPGPQTPNEPEGDDDSDTIPFAGPAALLVPLSVLLGGALHRYGDR